MLLTKIIPISQLMKEEKRAIKEVFKLYGLPLKGKVLPKVTNLI